MKQPNLNRFAALSVMLTAIFFLSGGHAFINHFIVGVPVSALNARFLLSASMFGGFLFVGALGLIVASKNASAKGKVTMGFLCAGFSYVCVELLLASVEGCLAGVIA